MKQTQTFVPLIIKKRFRIKTNNAFSHIFVYKACVCVSKIEYILHYCIFADIYHIFLLFQMCFHQRNMQF